MRYPSKSFEDSAHLAQPTQHLKQASTKNHLELFVKVYPLLVTMSAGAPISGGLESESDARSHLLNILAGLSRFQWSIVRATRRIAIESRKDYVASLSADVLTEDALQAWEECIQGLCHVFESDSSPVKRFKNDHTPVNKQSSRLSDLFQCEWFAAGVCSFLATPDACHLRAAAPLLSTCVAGYAWDDLTCPVPFQSMDMWRKCFPRACGANVMLPTLPHPSITSSDVGDAAVAPHDVIFERFKGLRRLRVDGVNGYVISDAAFAHLAGIVELEMSKWGNIALLTDEGLKHLAGISKLNVTETYSVHISPEGFRHLSGIRSLQVVASVWSRFDSRSVWKMTDDALFHLRGVSQLTLTDFGGDHDGVDVLAGISDAGFAHLRGILELKLAAPLEISALAFSHLAGIASLEVVEEDEEAYDNVLTDDTLAYFKGIERLTLREAPLITDAGLRHLTGVKKLQLLYSPELTGAGFVHLAGIQHLEIANCPLLTDTAFQHLRRIRVLSMTTCPEITDAAFVYLVGLISLRINDCSQQAISDKAFAHLAGIQSLDIRNCSQKTITSEFLHHLTGIQRLSMISCPVVINAETFASLRHLTLLSELKLHGAPVTTILAALQVFQGNPAVEPGLWQALSCDDAVINIGATSPRAGAAEVLSPFYDLASATSLLHLLRRGLSTGTNTTRAAAVAELSVSAHHGVLRGPAAEVVLAARLLLHVARRSSERNQLVASDVVAMLLGYTAKQSLAPILRELCSAFEVLCQYPEFAAQVHEQGGVAVLVSVLSTVYDLPGAGCKRLPNPTIAAAVCRSLCWVLTHRPSAGTALADLRVMPLLLRINGSAGESASAAGALATALVLALNSVATSQQQRRVGGAGIVL